ncbi:DUF4004 family protein [Clostridium massiliamazoniense]|uniref:DUF4004 family protein n=1 Tax=Clostridium massiliamazoniense TaxID=1347366 RepID=UPI0006D7A574|nr:DUF4004 family protein [Clostridium massiliamazoniense]
MEEKLISKKDLLELTGISYGQLYRWKRKKIIPEEWFIKKSVSTGQETFFPMEKILVRIREILSLKDESSLDELANIFSNNVKSAEILRKYIIERNIVPLMVLEKFEETRGIKEKYSSEELVLILIFDYLINSSMVSFEEASDLINAIEVGYEDIKEGEKLILKRKLGILFYYLSSRSEEIIEDKLSKKILEIDFDKIKKQVNSIL